MTQQGFIPSADQEAIIVAPLVPLRVIAGAGTGKTATIAHRVAHLVFDLGIAPEQILGITFTNKAAGELSQRIRSVMGLNQAHGVEVHTYHGFGAQILSEFGPSIGMERNVGVIGPAFTRQLLHEVVSRHPLDVFDPTPRGAIEKLRRLSSSLSDHLLYPHTVKAPEPEDEVWKRRAEMLAVLSRYELEKRRLQVVDYGDLIREAFRLCVQRPDIALQIRDRYRAVICDEYQDTNPAQRELLRVLFDHEVPVTVIGDPDQTIYEWRGASLGNLEDFHAHFGEGPSLPLLHNRRSGPEILEVANRVRIQIRGTAPRLLADKDAMPATVAGGWFANAIEEADWIAHEIEDLHEQGYRWRDIVILFRKNKDMNVIHRALAAQGIPFEVTSIGGLLEIPEVVDIWAWLRVIDDPGDGVAAARILLGSRFRLGLGTLAELQRWVRARDTEWGIETTEGLSGHTLIEAIEASEDKRLRQFRAEYRTLVAKAQGSSLVELCRAVLDLTGAWTEIDAMSHTSGLSARLNLYRFLDLAEQWSPLEGRPSLRSFLEHLGSMKEEGSDELDQARISDADAVSLMTVHRAKGLEWPVVFIPAAHHRNYPGTGRAENPLSVPEMLPFELRLDLTSPPEDPDAMRSYLKARERSQEWRIAYVAVTRARRNLTVTGAHWYGHPKPLQNPVVPGALYELVESAPGTRIIQPVGSPPPQPSSLQPRPESGSGPDPLFGDSWAGALRSQLGNPEWAPEIATSLGIRPAYDVEVRNFQELLFRLPQPMPERKASSLEMSVTGLVTYATCPRRYYWTSVDRLPARVSAAARRGTAVHRQIELHNLGIRSLSDSGELFPTPQSESRPFTAFLNSRFAKLKPVAIEAPFELSTETGARVRGRIDAIYDRDETTEIVDFKTGRHREDPAMDIQLEAYAIAARDISLGVEIRDRLAVTFAFLGDSQTVEKTQIADHGWLSEARQRISTLTARVASGRWEPTPGEACRGCDFLRFCDEGRASTKEPLCR